MTYQEAYQRLEQGGENMSVSMRKDTPVELLIWDEGLNRWDSYCIILDDETIPADAASDIEELY